MHAPVHSPPWWYGAAWRQNGPVVNGSHAVMYLSGKGADDWASGGFIANVLWNGVDNSCCFEWWIEAGDTKGWEGQNLRTYYWARNVNVGTPYAEHQVTSITPNVGSYMPVQLQYIGSATWAAYFNYTPQSGPDGSTYLYNTNAGAQAVQVGLESTSPYSYTGSTPNSQLDYIDGGSSWSASSRSGARSKSIRPRHPAGMSSTSPSATQ
jgi:hypothetical protein